MKKAKKFGAGGALLGAGLAGLGYALYDKYNKGKDKEESSGEDNRGSGESTPKPRIASMMPEEEKEYPKQGKYESEAGDETSSGPKGAAAKEYAPVKKAAPKKTTTSQTFPLKTRADEIVGKGYEDIGKTKTTPSASKSSDEPKSKPYPTGVKGTEKDPYLEPSTKQRPIGNSVYPKGYKPLDRSGMSITSPKAKAPEKDEGPSFFDRASKAMAENRKAREEKESAEESARKSRVKAKAESESSAAAEKRKRMQEYSRSQSSYKKGGAVKSASARADGCAIRGKTRA